MRITPTVAAAIGIASLASVSNAQNSTATANTLSTSSDAGATSSSASSSAPASSGSSSTSMVMSTGVSSSSSMMLSTGVSSSDTASATANSIEAALLAKGGTLLANGAEVDLAAIANSGANSNNTTSDQVVNLADGTTLVLTNGTSSSGITENPTNASTGALAAELQRVDFANSSALAAAITNGGNFTAGTGADFTVVNGNFIATGGNGSTYGGNPGAPFIHKEGAFVFQNGSAVTNGQVSDALKNGTLPENVYLVQNGSQGLKTHPVYGIHPTQTRAYDSRITDLFLSNNTTFGIHLNGSLEFHPNATAPYATHPRITDIPMDQNNGSILTRTLGPEVTNTATGGASFMSVNGSTVFDTATRAIPGSQNATMTRTQNPLIADLVYNSTIVNSQTLYITQVTEQIANATATQTRHNNATSVTAQSNGQPPIVLQTQNPLVTDLVYNSTVVNERASYITQVTEQIAGIVTATQTQQNTLITTVITQTNGQPITVVQTLSAGQSFGVGSYAVGTPGQTVVQQQTLVSNNTVVRTEAVPGSTVETRVIDGTTMPGGSVVGGSTTVETRPVATQQTYVVGGTTLSGGSVVGGSTVTQAIPTTQPPAVTSIHIPVIPGASLSAAPYGNVTSPAVLVQPTPTEITRIQEQVRQTTLPNGLVMEMTDGQIFEGHTTLPNGVVMEMTDGQIFEGRTTLPNGVVMEMTDGQTFEATSALINVPVGPGATHAPYVNSTIPAVLVAPAGTPLQNPAQVIETPLQNAVPTTLTSGEVIPATTLPNGVLVPASTLTEQTIIQPTPVISGVERPVAESIPGAAVSPQTLESPQATVPSAQQPSAGVVNTPIQSDHVQPTAGVNIPAGVTGPIQPAALVPALTPTPLVTNAVPIVPEQEVVVEQPVIDTPITISGISPSSSSVVTPQQPDSNKPIPAIDTPITVPSVQQPTPDVPVIDVPITVPAAQQNSSVPQQEIAQPSGGVSSPQQTPSVPQQEVAQPSGGVFSPQQGVSQPSEGVSSPQQPQQPSVNVPGSNTTLPSTPGAPSRAEQPLQNITSTGTNAIIPSVQQIPGVAQPSGFISTPIPAGPSVATPSSSDEKPEQPIIGAPGSNAVVPIPGRVEQPIPEQPVQNIPSNATNPIVPSAEQPSGLNTIAQPSIQPSGVAQSSVGNVSPSGVAQPSTGTTMATPGAAQPSSGVARPSGYNPVMQLPDGQVQNRPNEMQPGQPGMQSNSGSPLRETNQTVGAEPNAPDSNRIVEDQEGQVAAPSSPATRSAGNSLKSAGALAGSTFAAVVAMFVMSVV